ncbi:MULTISPECIES: AraC family transcriptional regulator [Paenibacillus]|uniref:AraC family transcriptional regulator n=1 Tax=Paenibacillus TaxID=44249 RepID=UPI002FE2ACEA
MTTQYSISYCYHGKQHCERGYCWGPGIKEQYKLLFIHEGKGRYDLNGQQYELEKGGGFAVYPGQICCMKADEAEPWVYSWIAFEGEDAETLLETAGLNRDRPVFECSRPTWFDTYLDEFEQTLGRPEPICGLALRSGLYRFLADWLGEMLSNRGASSQPALKTRYVDRTIEYIRMNYSNPVSITELARMIGIDRVYLSTLFKERMNLSPQKYLLQFRMNKARELLESLSLSVADVARSVGYSDPLLFSKMFKRVTGLSPSQYRGTRVSTKPGNIAAHAKEAGR